MNKIQEELNNHNQLLNSYIRKSSQIGLNEEWQLIALRFLMYRGAMSDVDVHLRRFKICQDRDNVLIKRDISGDRRSAYKDESTYTYSGIGKTCGLGTLAILSKYASDEQISYFYDHIKGSEKISMRKMKDKFLNDFGIDLTSTKV